MRFGPGRRSAVGVPGDPIRFAATCGKPTTAETLARASFSTVRISRSPVTSR
jgi:hypothetical protein